MNVQRKVAIISGASGAIGSATGQRLAKGGCRIVVGYNNRCAEAEKVAASLPGNGHRVARMPLEDTAVLCDVAAMVEREYGRCDVLVNSAGFTRIIAHTEPRRTDQRDLHGERARTPSRRSARSRP